MIGNTFVLIFTVYLVSMAAAVALLTIVYFTKPRPRARPKRTSPEFTVQQDAGLPQPAMPLSVPFTTSNGGNNQDSGGGQREETGVQTVDEAETHYVRVLRSPPKKHEPSKKQNSGTDAVGHAAGELAAQIPPAQPVESRSERDEQGTPVSQTMAREERSEVEIVVGEDSADALSTRRKQSDMKMDFFGSRSKKPKQEAAKTTQATPQKKDIRVDDSRRPRIVQPVVSNRQVVSDRSKAQPSVLPSQIVADVKTETTSQEASVLTAKENAATGEVESSPENAKALIEAAPSPPAPVPAVSVNVPSEQKGSPGEFSDLFARNSVEVTENNRLAEGMKEIDARDLLTEGLGLVARLKRQAK